MHKVTFDPFEHRYFDEGMNEYPSVTTIIKHFGLCPDYDAFGNEAARNFGTVIHRVCELFDRGTLSQYSYDPALEPYLNGYKKFISEFKPVWEVIETPFISKVWGFAGTPDRAGLMRARNWGIDLKSGAPHPSHEIQTGGYDVLIEENTKTKIKKRASLYLLPDDFRLIEHTSRSDRSVFIGLAQAYNWKRNHNLLGGAS